MNNNKIKLLLVGGYPPPFGGITVHLMRLYEYCISKNIDCAGLDISGNGIKRRNNDSRIYNILNYKYLRSLRIFNIIHLHVSSFSNAWIIYLIIKFFPKNKIIITIHSGSFQLNFKKFSQYKKNMISKILNKTFYIIAVNESQKKIIENYYNYNQERVCVIPAFINPQINDNLIKNIIRNSPFRKREKVLITSGYLFEYYGFEMIIEYLKSHQDISGIFVFYANCDVQYSERIKGIISKMDNAIYYENLNPHEFNSLLKKSSIYIRNTDRDGDCVAIREAAYWGLQIIASDAVNRPRGVELFSYNKSIEFKKSIDRVLSNPTIGLIEDREDYADQIIEIYKKVLNLENNK
ncbi:MAG: glycosyltransferase family 4 protein [Candidatus Cloacimonetes bacterium]|nr:glycosyltransferase family 4 protein [Candidatus Cloacimonadota bacterium]